MRNRRTVDEKVAFNRGRNTPFSVGYVAGVHFYRDDYRKADLKTKKIIKQIISDNLEFARDGDELSKGIMCGVRDAANERKFGKQGKPGKPLHP